MRLPIVLLALGALACSSHEGDEAPATGARPTVQLVLPDSARDSTGTTFVWYRVASTLGAAHDTLRQVMVDEEPVITPEGDLVGISLARNGTPDFAYRYSPRRHAFTRTALPPDVSDYFAEATFAPDGRALAYVAEDSASELMAVIRSWPDGAELFHHDIGAGFSSDVNFNHVRWLAPGQAEFAVRVDNAGGPWVHIVADRKGGASIDSLATEPIWGARGNGP